MKQVVLLRHAKSDWSAGSRQSDHERPLNARGRTAAKRMGAFLANVGQIPDLVITSSAVRARTTAELAAKAGSWEVPIEVTDALYATSMERALREIECCDDAVESVLLVGHEPTWSALAGLLMGGAPPRFPTGAMIRLDFETPRWAGIRPGSARLVWCVTPKLLARAGS